MFEWLLTLFEAYRAAFAKGLAAKVRRACMRQRGKGEGEVAAAECQA
jgi:hypothetical protein